MPFNIGEVEAVLTARDNMSAAIVAAATNVSDLTFKLDAMAVSSDASAGAYARLQNELGAVQNKFSALYEAQTKVVSSSTANVAANLTYGQSLTQIEGIAQRLIERMAILYAIRGTFQFVADIDTSAATLERLNATTGLSINILQQLQHGADDLDLPFTKVTTALDTFEKKISEAKKETVNELNDIGLSIEYLLGLDADQRFITVANAINSLPTPTARAKAEFILFNTDGIGPLLKDVPNLTASMTGLEQMNADTVRTLATVPTAFKGVSDGLKEFIGEIQAEGITAFAKYVSSADTIDAAMLRVAFGIQKTTPEFVNARDAIGALTSNVDDSANALAMMNRQWAEHEAWITANAKAIKPFDHAWKEIHSTGETVADTVAKINPILEKEVEQYLRAGISVSTLAKAFDPVLTEAQIKAVDISVKSSDAFAKNWEATQKRLSDLWTKEADSEIKLAETQDDVKLKGIDTVAKHDQDVLNEKLAKHQISEAQLAKIEIDNANYIARQKENIYSDEERQKLAKVSETEDKAKEAQLTLLSEGKQDYDQYEEALTAITLAAENEREGIEEEYRADKKVREQKLADDILAIKTKQNADELNAAKKKADEEKKLKDQTYSTEVTYQNFQSVVDSYVTGYLGTSVAGLMTQKGLQGRGGPGGDAFQLAQKGYSFQEIVNFLINGEPLPPNPIGPRIPGFASGVQNFSGGTAIVGEKGPEVVTLPAGASVYPMDPLGLGDGNNKLFPDEIGTPFGNKLFPNDSNNKDPMFNVNITITALSPGDARVKEAIRQEVEKVITSSLKGRVHLGSA